MLTYADSKDAETFNRCQVTSVFVPESNSNEYSFAVRTTPKGTEKELTFECDTNHRRDIWLNCIKTALAEVRDDYNAQKDNYILKLEFKKEKVGLIIASCRVTESEVDVENNEKWDIGTSKVAIECSEAIGKTISKVLDLEEEEERPCKMIVIEIVDRDLWNSGLKVKSIVRAINDTVLVGKVSSEQIRLLNETPKPYWLTFTGQNFKEQISTSSYEEQQHLAILKSLVLPGNKVVKKSFRNIVKGTSFEQELKSSSDKTRTILELLENQRRLLDILQNYSAQAEKKQEQQVYKE